MLRPLVSAALLAGFVPLALASNGLPSRLCFTAQGMSPVASVQTVTTKSTVTFEWSQTATSVPTTLGLTSATTAETGTATAPGAHIWPRAVSTGSALATVTSTKYITLTTQRTISATSVVYTTVTSQATAVLATPAGFTPLALNSNITAAGGATRKRSGIEERRALQNRRAKTRPDQLLLNPKVGMSKARFPQSVTCVEYVSAIMMMEVEPERKVVVREAAPVTTTSTSMTTVSSKATSSSKTTSPSKTTTTSSKSTSTISKTTSSSSQSRATTTITITSTSTIQLTPTTTTLLQINTTTTYLPAQTSLSICQPNNFVHSVAGLGIGFLDYPYETDTFYSTDVNAPDCCAACQLSGTCAGFLSWNDGFCILFNSPEGVCDATGFYWGFFTDGSGDRPGASVGNGNCGQAVYEGSGDWCENVFSGPCSTDG